MKERDQGTTIGVLLLVLGFVLLLMYHDIEGCKANGGTVVRGTISLECVK